MIIRLTLVFVFILSCLITYSQENNDNIDERIHLLTTIVRSQLRDQSSQGSGFFYGVLDTTKKEGWRSVEQIWLITNRHLVFFERDNAKEELPEIFTFYFRKVENDRLFWLPVHISKTELKKRLYIFQDSTIDIAAIKMDDLFNEKIRSDSTIARIHFVTKDDLPGKESMVNTHVTDDVAVIGYPEEFYDDVNLFPIVKSGIISTRWGIGFKNKPFFLIDAKLFPGSSGSIVISKPSNTTVFNGEAFYSKYKQFAFLGIYSGDYNILQSKTIQKNNIIQKGQRLDIGIVWYPDLIPQLIRETL